MHWFPLDKTTDRDIPEGEVKSVLILWFPERGLLDKHFLFTFPPHKKEENHAAYFNFHMAQIPSKQEFDDYVLMQKR